MGQAFKLDKLEQKRILGIKGHFWLSLQERGKRERKLEKIKTFSLRSMGFHQSEFVEPTVKVHLLDESHAYIPKRKDFTEDPKEEISGNQGFWAKEASYLCYYASRGRVLFTLVYFYLNGADLKDFGFKGLFGTNLS